MRVFPPSIDTKPSLRTDFLIRDKEFSHLALLIFNLAAFSFVLYSDKSTVLGSFPLTLNCICLFFRLLKQQGFNEEEFHAFQG